MGATTAMKQKVDSQHDHNHYSESAPQERCADTIHREFLAIKTKTANVERRQPLVFRAQGLAFRQGLTYTLLRVPGDRMHKRIVMTTCRRRSYSPLLVTKYVRAERASMSAPSGFTYLYASDLVAGVVSAGNTTPVWRRISVSSLAVMRLTSSPAWFTAFSSTRWANRSAS